MAKYLIDANLPYYFSLWNNSDCVHQRDIDDEWTDEEIWGYAKAQNLTIVTRDADFSNLVLLHQPPPKVIHIRIGNVDLKELFSLLSKNWQEILRMNDGHKLVTVFEDRVEGIT